MKSLWNEPARRELHARLDRLTPDMKPRWGSMTCGEMVAHLVEGMRMGTGEFPTKPRRVFTRRWPLKYLFIYFFPLAKGIPAPARQLVTKGQEVDWNTALANFRRTIDEFPTRDRNAAWPEHPYFGRMTGSDWGVMAWKHADHHLRQFGV